MCLHALSSFQRTSRAARSGPHPPNAGRPKGNLITLLPIAVLVNRHRSADPLPPGQRPQPIHNQGNLSSVASAGRPVNPKRGAAAADVTRAPARYRSGQPFNVTPAAFSCQPPNGHAPFSGNPGCGAEIESLRRAGPGDVHPSGWVSAKGERQYTTRFPVCQPPEPPRNRRSLLLPVQAVRHAPRSNRDCGHSA